MEFIYVLVAAAAFLPSALSDMRCFPNHRWRHHWLRDHQRHFDGPLSKIGRRGISQRPRVFLILNLFSSGSALA